MNQAEGTNGRPVAGPSGSSQDSPWTDIRNWLGFLIAGFGAVLSFIGLRSAEISTILRNDSIQVAVVAIALLLGILAAVYSLVIGRSDSIPVRQSVAIFGVLLGASFAMVFATPIQVSRTTPSELVAGSTAGALAIIFGCVWFSAFRWKKWDTKPATTNRQITFIAASVVLIGTSIFGATRTETDSQLSSSIQIGSSITNSASKVIVSVHVTAVKLKDSRYLGIAVYGLPKRVNESAQCKMAYKKLKNKNSKIEPYYPLCKEAPCDPKFLRNLCDLVISGTVQPDAAGNVNETISNGLLRGKYKDLAIVGLVCDSGKGCNPLTKYGSRLDLHIPVPAQHRAKSRSRDESDT